MVTHSSILAWRIPWTEEPRGLRSMGSTSVRHNWVTFTFPYWGGKLHASTWLGNGTQLFEQTLFYMFLRRYFLDEINI